MGGGRTNFLPTSINGSRKDGRNLIIDWLKMRHDAGLKLEQYKFVTETAQLDKVDCESVDYLLGLFANETMDYDILRNKGPNGQPSLAMMVEKGIKILSKNKKGFVLFAEGGNIDDAHHSNKAVSSLHEAVAFDKAIEKAMRMLSIEDTLFMVTADHSHVFTMNGYPLRGNDIFGIGGVDAYGVPYTTLMYQNGPGYQKDREDPSKINTSITYKL